MSRKRDLFDELNDKIYDEIIDTREKYENEMEEKDDTIKDFENDLTELEDENKVLLERIDDLEDEVSDLKKELIMEIKTYKVYFVDSATFKVKTEDNAKELFKIRYGDTPIIHIQKI